jgi:hypothetical protein
MRLGKLIHRSKLGLFNGARHFNAGVVAASVWVGVGCKFVQPFTPVEGDIRCLKDLVEIELSLIRKKGLL